MPGAVSFLLVSCFVAAESQPQDISRPHALNLRMFYRDTIKFITIDTEKIISSLLTTLNEEGIVSLKSTLAEILANSREISNYTQIFNESMCAAFDAYRVAIGIAESLRDMRDAIDDRSEILYKMDYIYDKWSDFCPPYIVLPTEQRITLMYTLEDWYLSHGAFYNIECCESSGTVNDTENNIWLKQLKEAEEFVRYGDTVGVGWNSFFLSNQGYKLNWGTTQVRGWERWRVENFCRKNYETYGVVRMGDLIQFHLVEDGHYFTAGGRTTVNGPYHYAILNNTGIFPSWRRKLIYPVYPPTYIP